MNTDIYFISGIDTDAGKSYCTAWYAKQLSQNGQRVITQKFIQTGNTGHSEDIDLHRRIMGTGYLPEDKEGLTMPEIFSYPCSPHLAARIDNRPIDFGKIERATRELAPPLRHCTGRRRRRPDGSPDGRISHHRLHRREKLSPYFRNIRQTGQHQSHPAKP